MYHFIINVQTVVIHKMNELVNGYASSSSEEEEENKRPLKKSKKGTIVLAAPSVPHYPQQQLLQNQQQVQQNQKPETDMIDWSTFDEQRKQFQRYGKALSIDGHYIQRGTYGHNTVIERISPSQQEEERRPKRSKQPKQQHFIEDEDTYGIWGPPSQEEIQAKEEKMSCIEQVQSGLLSQLQPVQLKERTYQQQKSKQQNEKNQEEEEEERRMDRLVERKVSHLLPPTISNQPIEPTTTFHYPELQYNYKGQSWITPPAGTTIQPPERNYAPKKCIGKFPHNNPKGIHRIRLFPHTGHLLLSAGLDGTCHIYTTTNTDDHNKYKCMRTYHGHSAAVRDIQFQPSNGKTFLSCSFDRYIRLWDTETGQVKQTFTNRRVPYVVQYYPKDEEEYFVVGCSDNKIVTYQISTGQITQEYNHHLAPVNTITFLEPPNSTMKMITSSDDKKVLIWEWDIAVPIKYVSDPTMHSMPVMTLHPTHDYILGQSLDNHIAVYNCTRDKFTCVKKKKFTSHNIAGYACDITISPDGRFVVSGDGNSNLWIWDWKRTKVLQKYRAHDKGPTIACIWHPTQPSTLYTCGWDGQIKIWQ